MTTTVDIYSQENIPTSNWMKFQEVGDACKGTFVEKFRKEWDGVMPDQIVFVLTNAKKQKLKIENGEPVWIEWEEQVETLNVWIKATNDFILNRLKNVEPWDIIAFAFLKTIPAKKKGYNPAKSIMVYKGWKDEEYLKELEEKRKQEWDEETLDTSDLPF